MSTKKVKCIKCKKLFKEDDLYWYAVVAYSLCTLCGERLEKMCETWLKEPAK